MADHDDQDDAVRRALGGSAELLPLVVFVVTALAVWRRVALWPAVLGLAALSVLPWLQIPVWRSDESLWRHAVAIDPVSGVARSNLGATLTGQRKYEEATRGLEEAVALRPGYAEAWNNLGVALAEQGRVREAALEIRRAVALNPQFLEARRNLDQAERLLGR